MADILPFKARSNKEKHRGNTLCRQGHHKWSIVKERAFDSREGRLVTVFECQRCKKTKVKAL